MQGSAQLPLRSAVAGQVHLKLTQVESAILVKEVWETPPANLTGQVSGTVKATLFPEEEGRRLLQVAVDLPGSACVWSECRWLTCRAR